MFYVNPAFFPDRDQVIRSDERFTISDVFLSTSRFFDSRFFASKGMTMFHVKRVQKESELKKLYALRYQVYCLEKMFLDLRDYPSSLEHDQYDASAIHLGAYGADDSIIGSLRLVRSTKMHFPIFEHCVVSDLPTDASSLEFAEISRLIISKRRRADVRQPDTMAPAQIVNERRDFTNFGISTLLMELFRVMFSYSKQRNIKYWLAAMEPSLMRLLQRYHFNFHPIGPMTDYYGQVIPCIASLAEIEKHVAEKNIDFYHQFARHLTDPSVSEMEETMWPPAGFSLS